MRLFRLLLPILIPLAGLPATAVAHEGLHLHQPWIREAPPGAEVMAGYVVVHNPDAIPHVLVGASSPGFAKAMLHQTRETNGVATMVHLKRIEIPAGKAIAFAPGGYHIMLMKPKHHYQAGDKVPVTLRFADGETLTASFVVRKGQ